MLIHESAINYKTHCKHENKANTQLEVLGQTSSHVELPNVDLALQLFEIEQRVHALQIIVAAQRLVARENLGHMRLERGHAAAAAFHKVDQVFGQRMRGQRASGFMTAITRAAAAAAVVAALAHVDW